MDRSVYRWINRLADHTAWAHWFFRAYADYGIVIFAALLVAALWMGRRDGDHLEVASAVWAAAATLVALGLGQIIGSTIGRARPYAVMTDVHVLVARTTDFSTPSDHATMAGAVAAGLFLANRRWRLMATAAALLMAFTRVYVGAHYPSDVLAGLALGAVVAVIGWFAFVPLLDALVVRLSRTPLRPLLIAPPRP
jgi:undecaprenyl-diphosphatase